MCFGGDPCNSIYDCDVRHLHLNIMWTPKIRKIAEIMHIQHEWWVHHKSTKEARKFDELLDADKLAYKMVAERIIKEVENDKVD